MSLRTKNAPSPGLQLLNCEKTRVPQVCTGSQSSHLEKNGPQGEPNSCFQAPLCLLPTSIRKTRIFLEVQLGERKTTEEIFEPSRTSRFRGVPAPRLGRPARAQPRLRHLQRLLERWSEWSRPTDSGYLQSPPKPRIHFPLNCPHCHTTPGLARRVPSPADPRSRFPRSFLYSRPSAGSPLSPDLLTRICRHSCCSPPGKILFFQTNFPLLFRHIIPIIIIINYYYHCYYSRFSCICCPTEHRNWVRSTESPSSWGKF